MRCSQMVKRLPSYEISFDAVNGLEMEILLFLEYKTRTTLKSVGIVKNIMTGFTLFGLGHDDDINHVLWCRGRPPLVGFYSTHSLIPSAPHYAIFYDMQPMRQLD